MRLAWKILLGLVVAIAALLILNAIALDNETKVARANAEGGEILRLSGGDVQVFEEGPEDPDEAGKPIVLIHCYTCSLRWWDRVAPLLAQNHRVIRVDLLGHGGSEKPASGYSIPEQAGLVAEAMGQLDVEGAVVVGHSMGGSVATALVEQSSQLVDRLVIVDTPPDTSFADLGLSARIAYLPLIGQAAWRLLPDAAVRQGTEVAFAPGYDTAEGFDDPDQPVADVRAMTYTSFDRAAAEASDYGDELPLNDRIARAAVPLLVIFGAEEQVVDDPQAALDAYTTVPGARRVLLEGAGHSPNVELPDETAALIEEFAADPGDEEADPEARGSGGGSGGGGRGGGGGG